jgi:hypothetical protein
MKNQNNLNQNQIILYSPNESISLEVRLENDSVWLTQEQIAILFGVKRPAITKHIRNIFETLELEENSVCSILERTASDGKTYMTQFYNLDMILSVGYRVNSKNAVLFRRWASSVLKDYLLRGYSLNNRLSNIEAQLKEHSSVLSCHQEKIEFFVRTSLPPVEGVFHNNQVFDAHILMSDLVKQAKIRIVIIDNYVDDSVLTLLSKRKTGVKAEIYTYKKSEQFTLDLDKHNLQYPSVTVYVNKTCHDRFMIVDDNVYHIGASIKDLGQKLCAVTLLKSITAEDILNKLK